MAKLPRWRRGEQASADPSEATTTATDRTADAGTPAPASAPAPAEPADTDDVTAPTVVDFDASSADTGSATSEKAAPAARKAVPPRGVKPQPRPEQSGPAVSGAAVSGSGARTTAPAPEPVRTTKTAEPAATGATTATAASATSAAARTTPARTEPADATKQAAKTATAEKTAPTPTTKPTTKPAATDAETPGTTSPAGRLRLSILDTTPVALFMAAHPKQAFVTAVGLGVAALASGRPLREAAVVAATAAVGQTVLGWHNDIVDRERDARHQTPRKPIAEGRIDTGTVWYALVVAVLLVVPLSISTGVTAGTCYLAALVVGILGNVVLRQGPLSWLPWAVSFALYPAYLSYGGWGGGAEGDPPQVAVVVAAALLGVGVHVVRAIWGLVADQEDGWGYLPLMLGRRLGASRLLILAGTYCAAVLAVLVILGQTVGLRQ